MSSQKTIFILLLLIGIFGSSIYLVESADKIRKLNQEVWAAHRSYDAQLEHYSRLRLEYGALTSLSRVEEIADNELGMVFPEIIYQISNR